MHEGISTRSWNSRSDNRKSKIKNRKWVGIVAVGVTFAICGEVAMAQQLGKVPRLGWLASPGMTPGFYEAFRQGLRELGYVEGKNFTIEHRRTEKAEQFPSLAAELVRLKVDVIYASGGSQPVMAAKNATTTIPIVMSNVDDPVAFGL
jgi:putative tryptophan/tyrosine transport system substrate-binding protein